MTTDVPCIQFRPGRELHLKMAARGENVNLVARRMCERYIEIVTQDTYPDYISIDAEEQAQMEVRLTDA